MRPHTLAEAYLRVSRGEPLAKVLSEVLDTFYLAAGKRERSACIAAEPAPTGDERVDAWAGAVAEYLAKQFDADIPAWASGPSRYLAQPWFTVPDAKPGMIEFLVHSSPAEFRSRNIFTESRPLRRASQHRWRRS